MTMPNPTRMIQDVIVAVAIVTAETTATITIVITIVSNKITPNQLRKPHAARIQDDKCFRKNNSMHRIHSLILSVDLMKLHLLTVHESNG